MKINIPMALSALAVMLTSCATPPPPPQAFHNTDNKALVIDSLNGRTCKMLQPAVSGSEDCDALLAKAMKLSEHRTAVVILENYTEPRFGEQFRDRGSLWFICLRGLGYEHIVFLRGTGVDDPEGLMTLVSYD